MNATLRLAIVVLLVSVVAAPAWAHNSISPEDARGIAKEAHIYGFPLVDNYRILYAYFVDKNNPEYK